MRRLLAIADNPGLTPAHRPALLQRLRESGLRVIALRVASGHLEVDLAAEDPQAALQALQRLGLSVREAVDLSSGEGGEGLERYVALFNAERFWEAHAALEGPWRRTGSRALQGLILLAAAFVKLQEGRPDKFRELLERAYEMLDADVGCISAARVRELIRRASGPFKIPCT